MKILLFLLSATFCFSTSDLSAVSFSESILHNDNITQDFKPKKKPSKKKSNKSTGKPKSKVKSSKGKPHKDPAYR